MIKILCIDDSEYIRSQLQKLFTPHNFTVLEANDGLQGLEVIRANPDLKLIICDVNMPAMDGITMCEKVKNENLVPGVPILILTTETSVTLKAKGKVIGITGWVNKPFHGDKLLATVQKLISEPKAA